MRKQQQQQQQPLGHFFFFLPGSNSRPNVSEGYEVTSELTGRPAVVVRDIISSSMYILYSKSMDQLGKVDNPAGGQLKRENEDFPVLVRA